jgi:transcriptional regulator
MYASPAFAMTDPSGIAAFVAAHPLALVCVNGPDGPVAGHVPLVAQLDEAGAVTGLIGHVARANPLWQQVGESASVPVLAVFRGPDAYVTPSAYPSKAEHGKVVPTWNYLAAELRGRLFIETDPARMDPYITAPTAMMEQHRAHPWQVADAPADYTAAMKRAIVGLAITVTHAAAIAKLSQNRSQADAAGVVADLLSRSDPAAWQVADLMTQARA